MNVKPDLKRNSLYNLTVFLSVNFTVIINTYEKFTI